MRWMLCTAVLGLGGAAWAQEARHPSAVKGNVEVVAAAETNTPDFAVRWTLADRASGVYYANEKATISVIIENPGESGLKLEGAIEFGPRPAEKDAFKPTATVTINASEVGPGKRARLEVAVTFGEPGAYDLRINGTRIESVSGVELKCIYPPRGTQAGKALPFITALPAAAGRVDGFISDYSARTGVTRFSLEEQFELDAAGRAVRAIGAATGLTAQKLDALAVEMRKSRLELFVRLRLPAMAKMNEAHVAGIATALENATARWGESLKGIVLEATEKTDALSPEMIGKYRAVYAGAATALRKQNAKTVLLGAGSAEKSLLLIGDAVRNAGDPLVVSATVDDVLVARAWKRPMYLLPEENQGLNPAVLLAADAKLTPVEVIADRGTTAHLLGGAVFSEQLNADRPPYVSVFQGDGFAVAAIAGLGAGTPFDVSFVKEDKRAGGAEDPRPAGLRDVPALEVADDNRIMRVVDKSGREVKCRVGDILFVPVGDRVVYLLMTGTADELTALLRTAKIHGLSVKKK